jgi:hypothetical protein
MEPPCNVSEAVALARASRRALPHDAGERRGVDAEHVAAPREGYGDLVVELAEEPAAREGALGRSGAGGAGGTAPAGAGGTEPGAPERQHHEADEERGSRCLAPR